MSGEGLRGWLGEGRNGGARQLWPKAPLQGVKVNVFNGPAVSLAPGMVLAAAALGLADVPPISRLVAGAGQAVALPKGFPQINGIAIFALPIPAQPLGDAAQNMASQVRHCYPRGHQEPRVISDPRQPLGPGGGIPADIPVPVGTLPGRRAKERGSQEPTLVVADQVLQVLPHGTAVTQVVVLAEQTFQPRAQVPVGAGADLTDSAEKPPLI